MGGDTLEDAGDLIENNLGVEDVGDLIENNLGVEDVEDLIENNLGVEDLEVLIENNFGDALEYAGDWIENNVGGALEDAGDWIVEAGDVLMDGGAAALEALGIDTAAMSAEEIAALALVLLV